ncbi:hypothetical protein U879_04085 [Defluviimonas sp. 20V17]|uniref:Membrane protein DedA, SNARE-associated domain n=1 Tax=Allgaiera indica TaxID=765699 RepID=A0AAN4UUK1_9RHOB|nr:VTT domain-containing protein [Allgaiera indica]KDB04925.1 hypothetical protein U879_04085 [Defluviimonas sp. 20V17]GHE05676.1 hypothetical protein GCM10008024_37370 [Allgaiera indica]SDX76123.1 membrane protein DedA, SNARE-associated domain [Allgaiera indica]
MTGTFLSLIPEYGLWLVAATTYLSCLALPVPSSLMMLAAGGFVASGDLRLLPTLGAAFLGAVAGDQTGFALGRRGGPGLIARLKRHARRAALIARAEALMARHGALGVFLSRWLFSPLGPWMNFAAGGAGLPWRRFTVSGIAGEALWVALYIGAGMIFAGNITAANEVLGSSLGLVAAGTATLALGIWLRWALLHQHQHPHRGQEGD